MAVNRPQREPGGGGTGGGHTAPTSPHDEIPAPDDAPRDVDPDDIPF